MSARTQWAMAIGCAVSVANLYLIQPLLEQVAQEFKVGTAQAGTVASSMGFQPMCPRGILPLFFSPR